VQEETTLTDREKTEPPTSVWHNGGQSGKMKVCASNKVSAWLTEKCFEIATFL
jgi:hypothetical protein